MPGIRDEYEKQGVAGFYAAQGSTYRNPHEPLVAHAVTDLAAAHKLDLSNVLDLACGSGEVSLVIRSLGGIPTGIDPYTAEAYQNRTGQNCEPFTFEQIAAGALRGRTYSLIACSFAMHLVTPSRLPALCDELRELSPALLILTPHKRPVIEPRWGWQLSGERTYTTGKPEYLRCRGRIYRVNPTSVSAFV